MNPVRFLVSRIKSIFTRRVARRHISIEWGLIPFDWCELETEERLRQRVDLLLSQRRKG